MKKDHEMMKLNWNQVQQKTHPQQKGSYWNKKFELVGLWE